MTETVEIYEVEDDTALAILEQCKTFKIKTSEDFAKAAEWLAFVNSQIDQIESQCADAIAKAHALHKQLCKDRKDALAPWEAAKNRISVERNNYQVEQERIREEAQRKAEAEAREKARKEQEALLARAAAAKTEAKQEELLEKAESVYVEPVFVPSVVEKKVEISTGGSVSSQKDFDVVVTDIKSICKAVVDGKLPVGIIEIRNNALKTFIKLQGIKQGDIEGLQIKTKFRDINRK
ncbi:MAG: hypothetical protein BroJett002_37260 [Candidatus Brocadia sinica]|nr:MAG: hypothetical protein BroJett002_37260 [Candidatus Brocadia sinica]